LLYLTFILSNSKYKLGLSSTTLVLAYLTLATRNSSGDEIANVNFLYHDIVHAVAYKINKHRA